MPSTSDADAKLSRARQRHAQQVGNIDAGIELGELLIERGLPGEAEAVLRRVTAAAAGHPGAGPAHGTLGVALAALGYREDAIAQFRRALAVGGARERTYVDLCQLLAMSGDLAGAGEIARRGVEAFPTSATLHALLGNVSAVSGDFHEADRCYRRSIDIAPPSAETLYNHGIALGKLGRTAEAIASYRRALVVDSSHAAAHQNLANILRRAGQLHESLGHFAAATRLAPNSAEAHFAEGTARHAAGEPALALASLERAMAIAPTDTRILTAVANALLDLGRAEQALKKFEEAVLLHPADVDALMHLGNAHLKLGDRDRAISRFREVLRLDPGNGVAHLVKALGGESAERAPDRYVAKLFDDYADRFDTHLVEELRYRTPELIADLLASHVDGARSPRDVLDLGCGTGLVGAAIASMSARLVGVDLSPKMLEKARASGHYARLEIAELLQMMTNEPSASYDAIIAADVFVYIGKLEEIVAEATRLLRPGGLVLFSVESLDASPDGSEPPPLARGYRLNPSGRYAHSRAYLDRLAQAHDLALMDLREATLRFDHGVAIAGYVVVWRMAGAAA